jgi:hypothetical protein
MALGITTIKEGSMGDLRYKVLQIAFDSAYVTGGEPFSPDDVGMDFFYSVQCQPTGGYSVTWLKAGNLLKVWEGDNNNAADAPGVEAGSTDDLSTSMAIVETFVIGI